jgi:hypothetical protein
MAEGETRRLGTCERKHRVGDPPCPDCGFAWRKVTTKRQRVQHRHEATRARKAARDAVEGLRRYRAENAALREQMHQWLAAAHVEGWLSSFPAQVAPTSDAIREARALARQYADTVMDSSTEEADHGRG